MSATDYKYDEVLDLAIVSGDFKEVDSTDQHQRCLLQATKGEYKQAPLTGIGIGDYLLDERPGNLLAAISSGFTADGMRVDSVTVSPAGVVNIDAEYE